MFNNFLQKFIRNFNLTFPSAMNRIQKGNLLQLFDVNCTYRHFIKIRHLHQPLLRRNGSAFGYAGRLIQHRV